MLSAVGWGMTVGMWLLRLDGLWRGWGLMIGSISEILELHYLICCLMARISDSTTISIIIIWPSPTKHNKIQTYKAYLHEYIHYS